MSEPAIPNLTPTIRRAQAHEIVDLRHKVLRQGLDRAEAIFPGDDRPDSWHVLAEVAGDIVGCATVHASSWQGEPALQLRGMAVAESVRSQGIGHQLLRHLEELVRANSPVRLWWCNARTPARRFYERQGWLVMSEVFDIPTAGPHVRMIKRLDG